MKSLKQVLKELRQLKEELPANLKAKVGNVFLGGTDVIAKAQKAKKEPNTPWEMDLEDHIGAWVSSSSDELAKYFKDNKSTLDQIAKEFPLLLQPPIGQPVYRGTSIKIDSLVEAFRTKDFEVVKIKGHEVFHFKNSLQTQLLGLKRIKISINSI